MDDTLSSTHLHLSISDGVKHLSASSSLFPDLSDRVSRSSSHLHQMHRALLPWIHLLLGTGVSQHQNCVQGSLGFLWNWFSGCLAAGTVCLQLFVVGRSQGNCGKCHSPVVLDATIHVRSNLIPRDHILQGHPQPLSTADPPATLQGQTPRDCQTEPPKPKAY